MAKLANTVKLNGVEKSCIKGMLLDGTSTEAMAKTLGRELEMVNAYVAELEEEMKAQTAEAEPEPQQKNNEPLGNTHFINKTVGNRGGVVIMTRAASERADASRGMIDQEQDRSGHVHKIK